MPILFNEDDHFDFEKAETTTCWPRSARYVSWGYFDPGKERL